jgi:ribosomal protein L29
MPQPDDECFESREELLRLRWQQSAQGADRAALAREIAKLLADARFGAPHENLSAQELARRQGNGPITDVSQLRWPGKKNANGVPASAKGCPSLARATLERRSQDYGEPLASRGDSAYPKPAQ